MTESSVLEWHAGFDRSVAIPRVYPIISPVSMITVVATDMTRFREIVFICPPLSVLSKRSDMSL